MDKFINMKFSVNVDLSDPRGVKRLVLEKKYQGHFVSYPGLSIEEEEHLMLLLKIARVKDKAPLFKSLFA